MRRCEGPAGRSSHVEKTREPFPLMVHEQTDPAGQFCAGTLSPSDCYPVGPVGLVATGGPVGPDVCFTNPNLLTHVIRTPPDPDGQDATTGPVGPYVGERRRTVIRQELGCPHPGPVIVQATLKSYG